MNKDDLIERHKPKIADVAVFPPMGAKDHSIITAEIVCDVLGYVICTPEDWNATHLLAERELKKWKQLKNELK